MSGKTTIEFPAEVLRKAKAKAAEDGVTLKDFLTEAVQDKLKKSAVDKPWMKTIGGLKHLHKENVRIQKLIDEEFGKIDAEEWE